MKYNKKINIQFRSDEIIRFSKEYYDERGVFLHFCTLEHDNKYKKVWENISEATKYDIMTQFIKDREMLETKYLEDQHLNNIPLIRFDNADKYYLMRTFKFTSWALYLNACFYKGMLRDIIGTTNTEELGINLYFVQDATGKYIYVTNDKNDKTLKEYKNKDFKIWVE